MGKYKKIYVLAPYAYATGGVELAHQLVDYLRNNGEQAFIVYISKNEISSEQNITEAYNKYNIKVAAEIEDIADNILILPEIYFDWIYEYKQIQIGCWWMSVDNHYNACTFRDAFMHRKGFVKKMKLLRWLNPYNHISYKNIIKDLKKNERRITHYYQSHYAQYHLYSLGFSKVLPLSDYINMEFIDYSQAEKEDIILYNPSKGLKHIRKLMRRMPNHNFVPLKKLSRMQLKELFGKAKLYVDFGYFPGKDRLFREAACSGCCIITGKEGASFFYEDVAISEEYKFDVKGTSVTKIVDKINYVLANYNKCIDEFDFLRARIKEERDIFYKEIENIFM